MVADWSLLATGLGIGVLVAAPIGPVNIMCIHRAVRRGFLPGLSAGIGAVFADGIFAAVAAFGITAIADFVTNHLATVKLCGGVVLVLFGLVVALRRAPPKAVGEEDDSRLGLAGATVAAFVLAITNPGTLLGFLGIFGGLGDVAAAHRSYGGAAMLVLGVMAGSLLWWLSLSGGISHYRDRVRDRWLQAFNLIAGLGLLLFGVAVLIDAGVDYFA
jgi:threonine/homoserine/homoserine lactone efflux protein